MKEIENKTLDDYIKSQKKLHRSNDRSHREHKGNRQPVKRESSKSQRDNKEYRQHKIEKRGPKRNPEDNPSVIVFNLPIKTTVSEIYELLSDFGQILKVNMYWVPEMTETVNAKVFFAEEDSCDAAIDKLNDAKLDGLVLKLKKGFMHKD